MPSDDCRANSPAHNWAEARYDLHTHSTASDGTLTPTELVTRAAQAGVQTLALTDHDCVDGLQEGQQAASREGLRLINGIELSVTWARRTIHIVGLDIDPTHTPLLAGIKRARDYRLARAEKMATRLAEKGIEGALEGAKKLANGQILSRTHFAHFLVEKGHAKDTRQVFKRFLVSGKPGHVAGNWATLEEAVSWITNSGGVAVIAHPARYKLTRTKLFKLIDEFKQYGGTAMEVLSGSHSQRESELMGRYAREAGLLASAGSDYHGPEKPWIALGRLPALPFRNEPVWKDRGWASPPAS